MIFELRFYSRKMELHDPSKAPWARPGLVCISMAHGTDIRGRSTGSSMHCAKEPASSIGSIGSVTLWDLVCERIHVRMRQIQAQMS